MAVVAAVVTLVVVVVAIAVVVVVVVVVVDSSGDGIYTYVVECWNVGVGGRGEKENRAGQPSNRTEIRIGRRGGAAASDCRSRYLVGSGSVPMPVVSGEGPGTWQRGRGVFR